MAGSVSHIVCARWCRDTRCLICESLKTHGFGLFGHVKGIGPDHLSLTRQVGEHSFSSRSCCLSFSWCASSTVYFKMIFCCSGLHPHSLLSIWNFPFSLRMWRFATSSLFGWPSSRIKNSSAWKSLFSEDLLL